MTSPRGGSVSKRGVWASSSSSLFLLPHARQETNPRRVGRGRIATLGPARRDGRAESAGILAGAQRLGRGDRQGAGTVRVAGCGWGCFEERRAANVRGARGGGGARKAAPTPPPFAFLPRHTPLTSSGVPPLGPCRSSGAPARPDTGRCGSSGGRNQALLPSNGDQAAPTQRRRPPRAAREMSSLRAPRPATLRPRARSGLPSRRFPASVASTWLLQRTGPAKRPGFPARAEKCCDDGPGHDHGPLPDGLDIEVRPGAGARVGRGTRPARGPQPSPPAGPGGRRAVPGAPGAPHPGAPPPPPRRTWTWATWTGTWRGSSTAPRSWSSRRTASSPGRPTCGPCSTSALATPTPCTGTGSCGTTGTCRTSTPWSARPPRTTSGRSCTPSSTPR